MYLPPEIARLILEFATPKWHWMHDPWHRAFRSVRGQLPHREAYDFPRIVIGKPNPVYRTAKFLYTVNGRLIMEYMLYDEQTNGTAISSDYDQSLCSGSGGANSSNANFVTNS